MIVIRDYSPEELEAFQKKILNSINSFNFYDAFVPIEDVLPSLVVMGRKATGMTNPIHLEIEKKEITDFVKPTTIEKLKANAKYGVIGTPPKPKPISREEGQCDWCSFRATDVCGLGHSTKDHCGGMGHRMLECPDYMWYGTPKEQVEIFLRKNELDLMTGHYKWCKCREDTRYARLYMKVFRWFKDWQFNRWMNETDKRSKEKIKELDLDEPTDFGILTEDTGIMRTEFEGELLSINKKEE